jgi:allophanate hydrolase
MNWEQVDVSIAGLRAHYLDGDFKPAELVEYLLAKSARFGHKNIWIRQLEMGEIQSYIAALEHSSPAELPLYGVPFAIKDNIDLAGIPTTAACQDFAYLPQRSAFVVEQLIAAGAIPLGKTNLDQFATGLVGTRSPEPWGPCRNAFDDSYISGGSSSGSAVALALGLVSFSLGTDTAGSGRVPAALNNLVGLKPTKGLLSTSGVVPACRSLDVVSIFALTAQDAAAVFNVAAAYDPRDAFARANTFSNGARLSGVATGTTRLGVPPREQLAFFGDEQCEQLFFDNVAQWRDLGAEIVEIDFAPFLEAARLLYEGPWVTERFIATREQFAANADAIHPVVRQIIEPGRGLSAVSAFESQYRLAQLKKEADREMARTDMLLTPTIGSRYRIEQLLDDPIALNSNLGYYTNYMNLLDYSAIAVPGGFTANGMPAGFTLVADKCQDQKLLAWASRWQAEFPTGSGATGLQAGSNKAPAFKDAAFVDVVVCGAHLEGLALNWQLTERGAQLVEKARSAPNYRLYALADGKRPGMIRDAVSGRDIEIEVWRLPAREFGGFVAGIPAPLGIGKVELADGRWESGFICDAYGLDGAADITHLGSWREYLKQRG